MERVVGGWVGGIVGWVKQGTFLKKDKGVWGLNENKGEKSG